MNTQSIPATFLRKMEQVQECFSNEGIPFRLLGSVATYSYVQGTTRRELNFSRSTLLPRHQQIPDLDFLVPRHHLEHANEVRVRMLADRIYPINVELLSGICHFDWRPGEECSYVFHRNLRASCATSLFEAQTTSLDGVNITTVGPRTLLHTYVTMGVTLREKDREFVRRLACLESGGCGEAFRPFHDFIRTREEEHKFYVATRVVGEKLRRTLPTPVYYWIVNGGKRLQPLLFGKG